MHINNDKKCACRLPTIATTQEMPLWWFKEEWPYIWVFGYQGVQLCERITRIRRGGLVEVGIALLKTQGEGFEGSKSHVFQAHISPPHACVSVCPSLFIYFSACESGCSSQCLSQPHAPHHDDNVLSLRNCKQTLNYMLFVIRIATGHGISSQ